MRRPKTRRTGFGTQRRIAKLLPALAVVGVLAAQPAAAVIIELKDVASDRVERQRAEAVGLLPLAGTPNVGQLAERLAEKKMAMGNPILIRVFKASSELEVWMQSGDRFELFAIYPICNWSGTLGPKLTEGDKQSPEGVYTVTSQQLHLVGRHPRSLNLGFPNALDRQMSRTGSYILIHGGCSSVGCFAMTNPVIEEVYSLALAALGKGKQDALQVHVYPFRMTEERLQAYALNEWHDFWRNLKDVSDSFERTHQQPHITICEGRYWVEDGVSTQEVASQGPLAVCAASQVEAASSNGRVDADQWSETRRWPLRAMLPPSQVRSLPQAPMLHSPRGRLQQATAPWLRPFSEPTSFALRKNFDVSQRTTATTAGAQGKSGVRIGTQNPTQKLASAPTIPCSLSLTSCRHWLATIAVRTRLQRQQMLTRGVKPNTHPRG